MGAPKRATVSRPKRCRCITKVNKALDAQNHELALSVRLTGKGWRGSSSDVRTVVDTVRVAWRPRSVKRRLVATYCPFCGVKYPERDGEAVGVR